MSTLANLTGNVTDSGAVDFDARRTKVWLEASVAFIVDEDDNRVRLGPTSAAVDSEGSFTFTDLLATNSGGINPTGFQYRLWVDYAKSGGDRTRVRQHFGWFSLTATTDLSDVIVEQYAPPNYQSTFMAQAQALLDAQVTISGIDDTDSGVAGVIGDELVGPLTDAAFRGKLSDVDADPASEFRVQQDARLSAFADELAATYAPLAGDLRNPLTGMYHAIGFGDGTKTTSNVNAAIAAAKATGIGGVIYLDAGEWDCDEPINMSSSQVLKLLGAGQTLTRVVIWSASDYGFVEAVGSPKAHIEGIGFTMGAGGSAQFGILAGRAVGNASVPHLKFKDVYIFGRFAVAGCIVFAAEQAHYEDFTVWAEEGAALVLARDSVGWDVTAAHTAPMNTEPYGGGNGLLRLDRVQLTTVRNATDGPDDHPLVLEYAQTFVADSLYTLSSGPALVVLDKRIDEATIRGLHQEWSSGAPGATEPYGIYLKDTISGAEQRIVRLSVEGGSIYPIYGEDNVAITNLRVVGTGWRANSKAHEVDVYSADVCELPVAGGNYSNTSGSEASAPTYQRRDGGVLVVATPVGVLKVVQALNFPSIAAGGVATLNVTVPGARVGDPAFVTVSPAGLTAGIVLMAGVSAVDNVQVRAVNVTTGAVDPASVTTFVTVMKGLT